MTRVPRPDLDFREDVPLAPFTTLGLGGPARGFVRVRDEASLRSAIDGALAKGRAWRILGGGSNLVVSDAGFDGVVIHLDLRGVEVRQEGFDVRVCASAGEPWDALVERCVDEGWSGLECLSGIPGTVGATPIQNVGAYGVEIRDTLEEVRVYDCQRNAIRTLGAKECRLGYRTSRFKAEEPGRFIVLAAQFRLRRDAAARIRYAALNERLQAHGTARPSIAELRRAVLEIRAEKSMVLSATDPNRRTCGSFFLNPVVSPRAAAAVRARASSKMPFWEQPDGGHKLAAAWLIQNAGLEPGYRQGAVGISTKHALALVCHEGATTRALLALAQQIRNQVFERFQILLEPEPVFWGFRGDPFEA